MAIFTANLLLLSTAATPVLTIANTAAVELEDPVVRLGDIADLSSYSEPLRSRMARRIIWHFDDHLDMVEVPVSRLQAEARMQFPMLRFEQKSVARSIRFHFVAPRDSGKTMASAPTGPAVCAETTTSLATGAIITQADTRPVPCRLPVNRQLLRYDRHASVLRAGDDIAAGQYLGAVRLAPAQARDSGTDLLFIVNRGPARVIRRVSALQPAIPGQRLFVETADGRVLSTIYHPGEPDSLAGEEP
ncbi:MAG: hypothetical protein AAFX04_10755 [Pseudomonadota bacterium]